MEDYRHAAPQLELDDVRTHTPRVAVHTGAEQSTANRTRNESSYQEISRYLALPDFMWDNNGPACVQYGMWNAGMRQSHPMLVLFATEAVCLSGNYWKLIPDTHPLTLQADGEPTISLQITDTAPIV